MSARRTNRRPTVVAKPPPTAVEPSNRLPILIAEIRRCEVLAGGHGKAALMLRLDEGDRLRELKDSVEHGQWLRRLKELGIHEMRARRYIRLADHRPLVEAKSDLESDLGLTDALNYIADFEARKKREADGEYQKAKQEREQDNRRRLAVEMKRRAKHDAKLKRLADAQLEQKRLSGLARAAAAFCRIGGMAAQGNLLTDQTDRRVHHIRSYIESVLFKEANPGKRIELHAGMERVLREIKFQLFARAAEASNSNKG